jgi:hypothetical protein
MRTVFVVLAGLVLGIMVAVAGLVLAWPARADPETDFAFRSAEFVTANLQRGTTTAQAWQFLGAAINTYCPEQTAVLQRAAEQG